MKNFENWSTDELESRLDDIDIAIENHQTDISLLEEEASEIEDELESRGIEWDEDVEIDDTEVGGES